MKMKVITERESNSLMATLLLPSPNDSQMLTAVTSSAALPRRWRSRDCFRVVVSSQATTEVASVKMELVADIDERA
jgi:hypothetical protein